MQAACGVGKKRVRKRSAQPVEGRHGPDVAELARELSLVEERWSGDIRLCCRPGFDFVFECANCGQGVEGDSARWVRTIVKPPRNNSVRRGSQNGSTPSAEGPNLCRKRMKQSLEDACLFSLAKIVHPTMLDRRQPTGRKINFTTEHVAKLLVLKGCNDGKSTLSPLNPNIRRCIRKKL
jgi:hypothetical protein